eukprot:TRINITY_DN14631_c0_g3_i1.p2 TRINITY_DN14631_c0_g3~~TRINITY_DN14631_c0_g3_i1.p2  ORF type:complete len:335 (-),score=37.34 TRINITY_DN14631_c0_g3_i1:1441-2445(-)
MYLNEHNFSIWCDFIERDFLKKEFLDYTKDGLVSGATSNPSIFFEAISKSPSYKNRIDELKDLSPKEIYETIAIEDIQQAADILKPIYDKNGDGFISLEIDPSLCDDVKASIEEGERLTSKISRENLMIKVPATEAGYSVIKELVSEGINVNVTLIFSPTQAKKAIEAIREGHSLCKEKTASTVLSVFVSRFDRKCDSLMKEKGLDKGKLGIYNAQYIYNLAQKEGLAKCRTLFASTGVKGDEYPQTYYVDNLMHKDAINTIPTKTIDSLLKSRNTILLKPRNSADLEDYFKLLKDKGIDIDAISEELLVDGLEAFKKSFSDLLTKIEEAKNAS